MAISKPCPKCQAPLSIPEPIPEKIQCGKCGGVIKFKVSAPLPSPPGRGAGGEGVSAPSPAPKPTAPVVAAKPDDDVVPIEFIDDEPAAKPVKPARPAESAAASSGLLSMIHAIIPKPILFG